MKVNTKTKSRNIITSVLMALMAICLVVVGMFFIAPIEAKAEDGTISIQYILSSDGLYDHDMNFTENGSFLVKSNNEICLDGGGNKFSFDKNWTADSFFELETGAKVTIKNADFWISYNERSGNFLFDVPDNCTLELINCTFDGYDDITIVNNRGTVTITDCSFNRISPYFALIRNYGKLTVNGSTNFVDCNDVIRQYGDSSTFPSMYINGNVTFNNVTEPIYIYGNSLENRIGTDGATELITFTNCDNYGNGGAIHIDGASQNGTKIYGNVSFFECKATLSGGAIYIDDVEHMVDIYGNVNFYGCVAGFDGGAIRSHLTQRDLRIYEDVVFKKNKAYGLGGAICGSNIWIGRTGATGRVTITNNSAGEYGGGIAAIDNVYLGSVDVTNNTAGSDTSSTSGGGVSTRGLLEITSSTNISNNKSVGYGGGIYANSTATVRFDDYMPYIDGNTNTNNEASDIYLQYDATSDVIAKIQITNALVNNAYSGVMSVPIGLRVAKTGTAFTTGWANANQAISDVFVSERSGYYIAANDSGELYTDVGYAVTIDPNDGATTGTTLYTDETITWADTASYRPSRTGYTFKGWTTKKDDASSLVLSSSKTTYTPSAHVTLYGLWEVKTYDITYHLLGGSVDGWTPTNFTATYGESYMLVPSTTPTRSGYTFTGWKIYYQRGTLNQMSDLPEKYIGATVPFEIIYGDLLIVPAWTERTVSSIKLASEYQLLLHNYYIGDALKYFEITVTYDNGETANVPVTEDMLSNFSTDTATETYRVATVTYGGATMTFKYNVSAGYEYTVEHYQENANADGYTLVSDDTQTLQGVGTTAAEAKTYTGFAAQSFSQESISEDGTTVVKIYYDRNRYTITFDMQGGVGGTTEVTVKHGQTNISDLVAPTKAGYTFNGYYPSINGGGSRWFDDTMTEEHPSTVADATVYAYWTERLISKIEISADSQEQSYVRYAVFVPFDITAIYDNGETETVSVTEEMLSDFDTSTVIDSATATVTYGGKKATFTYSVAARKFTLTYNVNGATGTGPESVEVEEGSSILIASAEGLSMNAYTFAYWMWGEMVARPGNAFEMPSYDVEFVAYWSLKKPTLAGTAGGALNYTYTGSAYNVTVNPSHTLGNEVTYAFRWFRLNEGEENLTSIMFGIDRYFESRCTLLLNTSGTIGEYGFTNVSDSGVYYCVVTAIHGENTSQTAVEFTVNIAKADQTITLSETEFTYSESLTIDFGELITEVGDGTTTYAVSNRNGVIFDFANGVASNISKAGGTFTLTVTKAATDNYNETTQAFTITLNKQTVIEPIIESKVWTGETLTADVPSSDYYTVFRNYGGIDKGNYEVMLLLSVDASLYKWATSDETTVTLTFTITATANEWVTAPSISGWTYGQNAVYPTYEAKYGNFTVVVEYRLASGTDADYTTDMPTNAGDYKVRFTVASTEDYGGLMEVLEFSISKATPRAYTPTRKTGLVYTGEAQELIAYGSSSGGTMHYRLDDGDWSAEFPKATNAGKYKVYYKVVGDENYNDADGGYVTVEIGKANAVIDGYPTAYELIYSGLSQTLCGEVTATGGTIYYKVDNGEWSTDLPSAKNAGTYTVYYYAVGDSNHKDSEEQNFTVDIQKKNVTVTADDKTVEQYKEMPEFTYTVTGVVETNYSFTTAPVAGVVVENTNEYGTYTINVSGGEDTNYNFDYYPGTLTITEHSHNYSKLVWSATEHWYICSVCDKEQPDSGTEHSGGTATCQAQAVCTTCNQAYGNLGGHSYGTTWEYKNATGHAHVCTVTGCTEHSDIEAHTPDIPAATEASAQYCTTCEYQMAAQLNHTHSPANEWTSNGTHHWKACGGCEAHLDEDTHSYDQNNACDTTCEVCNATREVTHNFTGEWEKDASGHWHVCTKNGCTVTDTKQNHVSAGAATETDPEVCSVCGWVINPALGHTTHTAATEWQTNETHHWHECTGCDGQELNKAAHNDGDNNGSCDDCGYTMTVTPPPHTHSHGTTWVTDADEHWNECECGDKANKAAHADSDNNGKCDTCDYEIGNSGNGGSTVEPPVDTDPPVEDPDNSEKDEEGLGTGAIVAIVVCSVVGVGGGGFALYWFVIRKRRF